MIVSVHQPSYMPWLGYFDKISRSDVFIFLDTVQFEKNSYINRNKIKTPQGESWLTVPVKSKGHMSKLIIDIQINNVKNWRQKHLKSIFHNYKKCVYFDELYPKLEILYQNDGDKFADLMFVHTKFWLKELKISTEIIRSSQLTTCGRKSELILNICDQLRATKYISGFFGKSYLDELEFRERSIEVEYQNYKHPKYPQLHGDFLPNMAIVDFLMNTNETNLITTG